MFDGELITIIIITLQFRLVSDQAFPGQDCQWSPARSPTGSPAPGNEEDTGSIERPADSACRVAVVLISTPLLVASQQHAGGQTGILTLLPVRPHVICCSYPTTRHIAPAKSPAWSKSLQSIIGSACWPQRSLGWSIHAALNLYFVLD